jgi:hypothetical protein
MNEFVGKTITLRGDHPWAGESGVIREVQEVNGEDGWRVDLSNGHNVFVFKRSQFRVNSHKGVSL